MSEPKQKAKVVQLPRYSGDGYHYGGGVLLVIEDTALFVGVDQDAELLAKEIARRWNAASRQED